MQIRYIRALLYNENYLHIIMQSTDIYLSDTDRALLHLRYIQRLDWYAIEEKLFLSRSTLFRIERSIIEKVISVY